MDIKSIKLNLRQIRYFCEVVTEGSAKAAADKLFVAPTAISMQLGLLEEALGGQVLDRASRPMKLTSLGQFVFPKAQELLALATRLEREAQGLASGKLGWLSVGFTRSAIFSILPDAVRAMKAAFPEVRIDLVEVLTENQPASLLSGAIQIGVGRTLGSLEPHPDLIYDNLYSDPLVAAIPIDHKLASHETLRASDLEMLPYISYPGNANSHFSRQVLSILQGAGSMPQVAHEAKEIHTALGLVAAGLGATVVGLSVSKHNRTDIRFVPINDIESVSTIFATRLRANSNPLATSFLDILKLQTTGLLATK